MTATNPLRAAIGRHRGAIVAVALFSFFVNLLMLSGPLFMLQVYDRVLPSRSEPTLIALFLVLGFMYVAMAVLDGVRARIGARIGAQIQSDLDAPAFRASMIAPPALAREGATALADLEALRRFLGSPLAYSFLDLPFAPLFALSIFIFHPWLGVLATLGGVVLVVLMIINQRLSRAPAAEAARTASASTRIAEQIRAQPETVRGLSMVDAAIGRWRRERDVALSRELGLADLNGGFGTVVKTFRLFLQSAMLALAAWLVIQGMMTSGGMIAASILMGRALAPIEQLVGGWSSVARAAQGYKSLSLLLGQVGGAPALTALPRPAARLQVRDLAMVPPGAAKPTLARISFALEPGQALGVVGESAAGKSTLARALAGIWPPAAGEIRLDGARLDQYDEEARSAYFGYLPQDVALFDGTVTENIARLSATPDAEACVRAAQAAGAHQMILDLPQGYDTPVGAAGARLSGGQRQRIGLARALYRSPQVLILDEPNSNLDASGSEALNLAIRAQKQAGGVVIIMAHRPAAIAECDFLLMLRNGQQAAFGPRDEVLRKIVANHGQIVQGPRPVPGAGALS